jgi:hypothetical protein
MRDGAARRCGAALQLWKRTRMVALRVLAALRSATACVCAPYMGLQHGHAFGGIPRLCAGRGRLLRRGLGLSRQERRCPSRLHDWRIGGC